MPKNEARATAAGRWSPRTRSISSLETNACTAPDKPKPRTRAHRVSQNMKKDSRRLSPTSLQPMVAKRWGKYVLLVGWRSGPDEPGDGRRRFRHLLVGASTSGRHGVGHAMGEVVVDQLDGHRLEGPGHGGDLVEDLD